MNVSWELSTIGNEFDVQLGKMLDAATNVGEPRKYLGNRSVQWGRIDLEAAGTVPLTEADRIRYRLQPGDLLVCEGGEVGRAAIWQGEISEIYFQKALHRLRPRRGYDVRVMQALLEYWSRNGSLVNFVTRTSIAHLPREKLVSMPLPVPPPQEQTRIAAALSDADASIATLERLIAKKQAIKQGLLQELLTGHTRLPGFTATCNEVRLGSHVSYVRNVALSRAQLDTSSPLRYLHYGDIHTSSETVLDAAREPMPRASSTMAGRAGLLRVGDLVFADASEDPDGVGKSVEITGVPSGGVVPGLHTITARFDKRVLADGFKAYVQFIPAFRAQLLKLAAGTKVLATTKASISSVILSLPAVAEQHAIATVLRDADNEIAALGVRLTKARAIKQGMMQQLLTGRVRLPVEDAA